MFFEFLLLITSSRTFLLAVWGVQNRRKNLIYLPYIYYEIVMFYK